jgi:hypothetical protein
MPGTPAAEVCDGVDNDCDGAVDNGNPGGGMTCSTGLPGVCEAGTTMCQGGSLQCVQNVQPTPEICDGLDNDCNGMVDEGNPGGGVACDTGLQGVCAAGTTSCQGGSLACLQNVQPSPEVCGDGLDNDCNGLVDDGCGVTFVITYPMNGDTVDCRPQSAPPVITWTAGTFDKFRIQVASRPDFLNAVQGSYLKSTTGVLPPGLWWRICRSADPYLYIRVVGVDKDVTKTDPDRTGYTATVQVNTIK